MTINGQKDFLSEDWLNESSKGFMGGAEIDPYNTPLSASPVWWKGLPVTDLGVCGGEYEIFLDDIKAWVEKVKVRLLLFHAIQFTGDCHRGRLLMFDRSAILNLSSGWRRLKSMSKLSLIES